MTGRSAYGRALAAAKGRFHGVSWRHPVVRAVLPLIDALERPVLGYRGLEHLPRYSIRIRSTGISHQFGGAVFADGGRKALAGLREMAGLLPTDDVLDLGCGAGRAAFGLVDYLEHGRYTGLDVDLLQIQACQANRALRRAGFRFIHADVTNDVYNPTSGGDGANYTFPFPDGTFDVAYLISVFTHMLPMDVRRYTSELMRVLRVGGRVVVSVYGKDDEPKIKSAMTFAHCIERDAWVEHQSNPLKAVAYEIGTLDGWFGVPHRELLLGAWRDGLPSDILQDVLVYEKPRT